MPVRGPGGSALLFQGFACVDGEISLARGFQASISVVDVWVRGWHEGFLVEAPGPDATPPATPPDTDLALASAIAAGQASVGEPPSATQLPWSGWLTWAEWDFGSSRVIAHQAGPMMLVSAQEVRRSGDGAISRVRLELADPRWLIGAGVLRRSSFNRRSAAGVPVADSLRPPDGVPWTSAEIAAEIVASLRGGWSLGRSPQRLSAEAPGMEFAPVGQALGALGDVVRRYSLEEPCPAWGRPVLELYEPGEAAALGGSDPLAGLTLDQLPRELALWLRGVGQSHRAELGWPADYVLVRGGDRIATARVDNAVPVLKLPDPNPLLGIVGGAQPPDGGSPLEPGYHPLTETLIRRLTGGRKGLEWLHSWLFTDRTHQGVDGVTRSLAALLDDQAYRLFQVPGVLARLTDAEAAALLEIAARTGGAAPDLRPRPGPNAHLLPMLDRAELQGDRRVPVTVETFHVEPVNVMFQERDERIGRYQRARAFMHRLKEEIQRSARLKGAYADPWGVQVQRLPYTLPPLTAGTLREALSDLIGEGVPFSEVANGVAQARLLNRIGKVEPRFAQEYERAMRTVMELEEADRDLLLDAGKLIVELEQRLEAGQSLLGDPIFGPLATSDRALSRRPQELETLRRRVLELVRDREVRRADRARKYLASGSDPSRVRPMTKLIHENRDRDVDVGAGVEDAYAGVVRTSRMAVWADDPVRSELAGAVAIPKPVRITFGCVVRPRRDVALVVGPARTPTGSVVVTADNGRDAIPTARSSERESIYVAAFRRGGANEPIGLGAVNPPPYPVELAPQPIADDALQRVLERGVVIDAPQLVELIPLGKAEAPDAFELLRAARQVAAGPVHRRSVVRADTRTFARPWPVRLDGIVAKVTIAMREGGAGFTTTVTVGSSEGALDPLRTRVRPAGGGRAERDARGREGTTGVRG